MMKHVFKMYVSIYKRLVFDQFIRIALNHIVQRKLPSFRQLANFATLVSACITGPLWVRKACKLNKIMLNGLGRPSDGPGNEGCHGNAK